MQGFIDAIILLVVWFCLLPLRTRMAGGDWVSLWSNHLLWAVLLLGMWAVLTRLDPWLRSRPARGVGATIGRLVGPVLIMVLFPQLAYGVGFQETVPAALTVLWGLAVMVLMTTSRVVTAEATRPPDARRSPQAKLGLWSAGLGLVVLACVPLFPDIRKIYTLRSTDFLVSFLRGVVQFVGATGLATAVGLALTGPLLRLQRLLRTAGPRRLLAVLAGVSLVALLAFAYFVLDHMPHVQDEIAIVFQAKNLAAGRLYAKVPPMIEAFDAEFVAPDGDRWYSIFLPGPSFLMVPGVWLGATWLINPLLSLAAVPLLYLLAKPLFGERIARWTVLLAVLSPFWFLTFVSQMSHPGCLTAMLVFAICLVKATRPTGRWYHAAGAGLAMAGALWFRPYTPLALAVPWLGYGLVKSLRRRASPRMIPWFAATVLVGIAPLFAYNKALTGDPLKIPQNFDPKNTLGFGPDLGMDYFRPDRRGHTPAKGLFNMGLLLDILGNELMAWPRGVLLLGLIGGLTAVRRSNGWLMLGVGASLPIAYIFYWFCGACYGARFYSEALPAYLMLVALGLAWLRRVFRRVATVWRLPAPMRSATAVVWAVVIVLSAGGLSAMIPRTLEEYGTGFWATDPGVRNAVRRDRPHQAIVFVQSTHYRSTKGGQFIPDYYGSAFWMNSPTLDDEVIFARDLDRDLDRKFPAGSNHRVLAHFPGRRGFRFVQDGAETGHLEPLEPAPTSTSATAPAR